MTLKSLREEFPWPRHKPDIKPSDHGWLTDVNKKILARFLSDKTRVILELGTWLGKSMRFMLDRAPNAVGIAVDHWRGSIGHRKEGTYQGFLPQLYERFLISCWQYRERIVPINEASLVALTILHDDYSAVVPNLIYIDGAHDFNSVYCDVWYCLRWFPNAVLVGDDYDPNSGEVSLAVDELAPEFGKKVNYEPPCWWYTDV